MSATTRPGTPTRTPRPGARAALRLALPLVAVATLVLATGLGDGRPATGGSGLRDAGPLVGWLVPLVRTGWDLATFATLGCLLVAGWLTAGDRSGPAARRLLRLAGRWSLGWALTGLCLVVVSTAQLVGTGVRAVLTTGTLYPLLWQVPQNRALVIAAVAALLVRAVVTRVTGSAAVWALLATAAAALVPVLAGGHAGASSHHYLAAQSLVVHVLAAALWVGGLVVLVVHLGRDPVALRAVLPRFSRLAGWCFAAVALSGAVGAWVRLGIGTPAWHSTYGALVLAKTGALVVLGLCGMAHRTWSLPRVAAGERRAFARLAAVEALVMTATAALAVVLARTPPPPSSLTRATPPHAARFATLDGGIDPLSVRTLLLGARPDVLVLTAAAVLVGGYLLAVARLRRDGDTWPLGRTLLFAGGVLLACWCLCGGLGAYSGALLSVEVARLLTMGLVVPVLVTAGRPAALARRGRTPAPGRRPGPAVGGRRLGRGNPADGLVALVGVLAVTLMTPLLGASLRSPALHLVVALAATAAGLLFVGPLLGLDRPSPGRRGSTDAGLLVCVLSLLLLVQAGHIRTSGTLLAVQWYGGLDLWWADPVADQGRAALVAAGFAVATLALVPLAAAVARRSGSAAPAGARPR